MPTPIYRSKLILASSSPRRRQLLGEAGYDFEIVVPSELAECGVCSGESPPELVARLAYQKAADVSTRVGPSLIVACDTVAECQGQVLGKPRDEEHARADAHVALRQTPLRVQRTVRVARPRRRTRGRVAKTTLRMDSLAAHKIDEYLAGGAWEGKAGAFGYQDGLDWVHIEQGSESNVVGLPMELLAEMLAALPAAE